MFFTILENVFMNYLSNIFKPKFLRGYPLKSKMTVIWSMHMPSLIR